MNKQIFLLLTCISFFSNAEECFNLNTESDSSFDLIDFEYSGSVYTEEIIDDKGNIKHINIFEVEDGLPNHSFMFTYEDDFPYIEDFKTGESFKLKEIDKSNPYFNGCKYNLELTSFN